MAVTFRPPRPLADPVPLPALIPQSEAAIQAEFQPAEVTRAAFPKYPANSFAAGAVVLEVTLSGKGEAEEVQSASRSSPFTEEAKAVVGNFRFMAATFQRRSRPIQDRSRVCVQTASHYLSLRAINTASEKVSYVSVPILQGMAVACKKCRLVRGR